MKQGRGKLPIKTKIAVWWLLMISVILAVFSFRVLFLAEPDEEGILICYIIFIITLVAAFLYLISGVLLVLKNRGAWALAMVILSLITLAAALYYPFGRYIIAYLFMIAIFVFEAGDNISKVVDNIFIISVLVSVISTLIPFALAVIDADNYWKLTENLEVLSEEPLVEPMEKSTLSG